MIAPFNPEKIKVLVFDVDDTITRGTLGIKINTFKELFDDRPDRLQEARELYEYTGKGDRYNIIAHLIEEPQENCTENKEVQNWAQKFEKLSQFKIRENGMHIDDVTALIQLHVRFPDTLYLLSATPQESVMSNMQYFTTQYPKLEGIFQNIIGNPMDGGKAGELQKIAHEVGCSADEVIMVGDGGSDYNGAIKAGTQFIGINPEEREDKWPQDNFPKVSDVAQILEVV